MQARRMLPSVLVLLAGHAVAQPILWNNPAGGAWNIASNWDPAVVPNSGIADVTLDLVDPYTVICNFSPTVSTLAITNPLATIDIPGGNSLFIIGGLLENNGLVRINSNSTVFDASLNYLALFNAQDPRADLAAPFGQFNFFDIAAFINNFNAGCP